MRNSAAGSKPKGAVASLRNKRGNCVRLGMVAAGLLLLPLDCMAYIDPNIGGWLFQLLFPVLVAIGGAWAVLRHRIGAAWDRLLRRGDKRE